MQKKKITESLMAPTCAHKQVCLYNKTNIIDNTNKTRLKL